MHFLYYALIFVYWYGNHIPDSICLIGHLCYFLWIFLWLQVS